MIKEPNSSDAQTTNETLSKMLIDRPSDFKFHVAYLVYSEAWDRASSNEAKLKLNENIKELSIGMLDYETFYREISQYRATGQSERLSRRPFIETSSKKDWRRRDTRARREARHGR
jgi:hypothetical protein